MTIPYIIIVILLCFAVLLINIREAKQANSLLSSSSDKHYLLATQITLFIGVLSRLAYLQYPYGINLDEAIAGYDAWCLANYGVDQHLYSYPVYLKSWGSGQSALYAYLAAPLVKAFGLNLPIFRLPMAIVSSVGLICLYYALKKSNIEKLFLFLCILFFVFNPWHFTKSRWALDCNLAPDILLIATSLIIIAFYCGRKRIQNIYYAIAFVLIGVTAYAYAVAWLMLPFYTIALTIFLYRKNKISIKQILISSCFILLIASPLIIFAFQLVTNGDALSIGQLSIPQLNESRHDSTSSPLWEGSSQAYHYITAVGKSLITGYDYLLTNSFPYTGQFYNPIGWLFIFIAFICFIRRKSFNIVDSVFLIWLLACIPIILFVSYNVNRWNMIWVPLVYFCIRGIYFCIYKRKILQILFYASFIVLTTLFAINYKILHYKAFLHDIEPIIEIISDKDIEKVYFTEQIQYPIILFYDPIEPKEFNRTKEVINPDGAFTYMKKFGKYNMGISVPVEPQPKVAYVIPNNYLQNFITDTSSFKILKTETLTVLWND